jgi:quinolinate synthase
VNVVKRIQELSKKKNAIILAHYYQSGEIQDIADFVGDSLFLSQMAASTNADIIVFAGVYFMAETAKILNPNKKILIPTLEAGCSLSDSCPIDDFLEFKKKFPSHKVVSYINCSAEIKAVSDIICTSANAESVISSFSSDENILFTPDENLGRYLIKKTGRKMELWKGVCLVHDNFSLDKLLQLCIQFPTASIIAHPESNEKVLKVAHFIGSTSAMISWVANNKNDLIIVGTEVGILHKLKLLFPDKLFIPVPSEVDNSCSCSECEFMKMNSLLNILSCLETESPEVFVEKSLIEKAAIPLNRMLTIS